MIQIAQAKLAVDLNQGYSVLEQWETLSQEIMAQTVLVGFAVELTAQNQVYLDFEQQAMLSQETVIQPDLVRLAVELKLLHQMNSTLE
jgi:hypothetical protein